MNFKGMAAAALAEDHAREDVTSRLFVPAGLKARAVLVFRDAGVLAGGDAAAAVFKLLDPRCRARVLVRDGRVLRKGRPVLEVRGPLRSLLAAERAALNLLSHLSGIATLTRRYVDAAGRGVKILDTRKTLPGLRVLEKYAVACGGGVNHRGHLADAVLIKENHLAALRSAAATNVFFRAAARARRRGWRIEMECQNGSDIRRALRAGADILLLDNFSPRRLRRAVAQVKKACRVGRRRAPLLEASGGVTLANVRAVARTGVNRISVGRLTHSAPSLDISMDVEFP